MKLHLFLNEYNESFLFFGKRNIIFLSFISDVSPFLFKFFIFYMVCHCGGPACGEIKTV